MTRNDIRNKARLVRNILGELDASRSKVELIAEATLEMPIQKAAAISRELFHAARNITVAQEMLVNAAEDLDEAEPLETKVTRGWVFEGGEPREMTDAELKDETAKLDTEDFVGTDVARAIREEEEE